MRLRRLSLHHFRNVGFATLELAGRRQFIVGANGQGKTSLLEAAGFLTALRSFRTTDNALLIQHGQTAAALAYVIEHEREQETQVTIKLGPAGKELWTDETRVTRLAEHLGRFPTVVFSSQDILLVRGAPANRRRWLDLTLAAMDAAYLRALQTYTRALAGRNALLRSGRGSPAELAAFEQLLAPAAVELIAGRQAGVAALGRALKAAYATLSGSGETAELTYEPQSAGTDAAAFRARLEAGRARDAQFRTTLSGPHRDDLGFTVKGTAARDFASEGQQRSLVLALRAAQAAWYRERSGIRPVVLADDVLGELDPGRRERFWAVIDPEAQVLATGTRVPDGETGAWQVFVASEGTFAEGAAA
jgi:DNA replication and repair protein RecF